MSSSFVSTRQQRFACARLPDPHLTSRWMPFPRSLTTTVFSQCSTRWFEASPRRAAPKGQPSSPEQHPLLSVRSPTYSSDSFHCSGHTPRQSLRGRGLSWADEGGHGPCDGLRFSTPPTTSEKAHARVLIFPVCARSGHRDRGFTACAAVGGRVDPAGGGAEDGSRSTSSPGSPSRSAG